MDEQRITSQLDKKRGAFFFFTYQIVKAKNKHICDHMLLITLIFIYIHGIRVLFSFVKKQKAGLVICDKREEKKNMEGSLLNHIKYIYQGRHV
jgi:cellulose synthase/poly-beta-1,6-N-acetylglucosamine synthase-like glycosyltransferase